MIWHYRWAWTNTYCGVLKVIKTVVCENKPSPFPGFHTSSWNISEDDHHYPNVKTLNVQLLLINHFRFSLTQYIPPEKTSSSSSSRGCESHGRSREEEKDGEEEEKDFISNSGHRPRHAEENQNFSLSCHKKGSLSPCFLSFQHRELTNQAELRSQCQIQEVRSITTQPERAFTTQRRSADRRINTDAV